jgi:hypothetical protein
MRNWFRKRKPQPQSATADADLERFFTDAEEARKRFQQILTSPRLERRITVVHGVGAVGKSSLLRMYRLACRRQGIAVALVGGEEAPSVVSLLDKWAGDLTADAVDVPATRSSLARYYKLRAKVEEAATKAGAAKADAASQLTDAAAKGIVTVAASAIPVAGPVIGAVGSEAVAAGLNLLRATLSQADYGYFLDPAPRLTEDFLSDLRRAAAQRRIVLMLDTFERITTFGDWLRELVRELPSDVLFVIAGRVTPDWEREWPGWVGNAEIIELTEMSDEDIARLVRQYYALFGRGDPAPEQVAAVVRFARGLPMAATTAVRLWVSYQLTDLQPVGPEAVADLADRLLEGVPAQLRPAFEAAAVLRYFNVDSLAAMLDGADALRLYEELRRWPFTRPREGGLAVHDTMREVITDALRARSPQQFRQLNDRAADYYARLLETSDSHERARLQLEWLYHSISADETAGITQFQVMAEELVRYQWIGRLRELMNDVNTYPLRSANSRAWRRYYAARLEHLEGRIGAAEAEYLALGYEDDLEPRLRSYALCDLGTIYVAFDRLAETGGEQRAKDVIERSQLAHPELDSKLLTNHVSLMNLSNTRAEWAESLEHIRPMRVFAESTGDRYGLVTARQLESTIHGLLGDWPSYLKARRECEATLLGLGDVPALQMQVAYFVWPLLYMGRYREAQQSSERALKLAIRLEEKELMITILESVALALGMQDAYAESAERFDEAWNFYENFHLANAGQGVSNGPGQAERYIRAMLSFRGLVALREGRLDAADADLVRAFRIKQEIQDRIGIPELYVWRGVLAELRRAWGDAETAYGDVLAMRSVNRRYFESAALAGIVRLNYARGQYAACTDDIHAAEQLAQRYEYNDIMASLRLFQGHLAWELHGANGPAAEAAAGFYKEALIYALRYNRYLLDEIVAGRPQGTPLMPLIPACLDRGEAGRAVLSDIHKWWHSATNDLPARRDESVSPLTIGVPLIDAEREARSREAQPGISQRMTIERIADALEGG